MKMINLLLLACCLTAFSFSPGTLVDTRSQAMRYEPMLADGILPQGGPSEDGSSWLDDLWQSILEGLQWIWGGILSIIEEITDFLTGGLQQAVQQAWDDTVGQAEKMVDDVLQGFQNRQCMSSLLPLGALAGVWVLYRRKHKS